MSNLQLFQFESRQVRVIDKEGEPWFVAKDLCTILGISKYRDAISRLDEDERESFKLDTPGGKQDMAVVSESGMYALVLSSRKPEAKAFRKWITNEVLPAIRKTGSYSLAPKSEAPIFKLYSERKEKNTVIDLPEGYWCVWYESMHFILDFEKAVNLLGIKIAVSQYDLLDGSIGSCWANYRKGKEWAKQAKTYLHHFHDRRGKQEANCYHRDEFWHFRDWLKQIYSPEKMPHYLKRKYGAGHDLVLRGSDIIGLLPGM